MIIVLSRFKICKASNSYRRALYSFEQLPAVTTIFSTFLIVSSRFEKCRAKEPYTRDQYSLQNTHSVFSEVTCRHNNLFHVITVVSVGSKLCRAKKAQQTSPVLFLVITGCGNNFFYAVIVLFQFKICRTKAAQ